MPRQNVPGMYENEPETSTRKGAMLQRRPRGGGAAHGAGASAPRGRGAWDDMRGWPMGRGQLAQESRGPSIPPARMPSVPTKLGITAGVTRPGSKTKTATSDSPVLGQKVVHVGTNDSSRPHKPSRVRFSALLSCSDKLARETFATQRQGPSRGVPPAAT